MKYQLVFPPEEMPFKNMYGELKSICFALRIWDKYIKLNHPNLIIYTDLVDIDDVITGKILFRKRTLRKVQKELKNLYQEKISLNPNVNLSIKYLSVEKRKYNPFYKAAHNAAIKLLRSQ